MQTYGHGCLPIKLLSKRWTAGPILSTDHSLMPPIRENHLISVLHHSFINLSNCSETQKWKRANWIKERVMYVQSK